MNFIYTLLAFLFALCLLIAFHELGHFWVARLCQVKVLRFSLGMGRVIFSRKSGADQTEWVISAIPLGGYVKMLDAREQDPKTIAPADLKREFTSQPVWKRIAIVAAGPMANFILAILLFVVLFMVGVPEPVAKIRQPLTSSQAYLSGIRGNEQVTAVNGKPVQFWSELRWEMLQLAVDKKPATLTLMPESSGTSYFATIPTDQLSTQDLESDFLGKLGLNLALSKAQLGALKPDSPALLAGLQTGDIVIEIDGKNSLDSQFLIETVRASPLKKLHFVVSRNGTLRDFWVTPSAILENDQLIGKLNAEVRSAPVMRDYRVSFFNAIQNAVQRTWTTSVLTLKMIGKMVVGEVSLKNITGPLTIADYAGQTAKTGWVSYLSFLAFVSISLGVMNLLPIPILDGGHLLYYSLELITGRPVSARFGEIAQRAGLVILMLLMAVAFFNDIVRLLPT